MRNSLDRLRSPLLARRDFLAMALPFAVALPGYKYEFPRDHYAHPQFKTEWWYYTGNLFSGKRRFGFQLTFFRQAESPEASPGVWAADPLWFAHAALSDLEGGKYLHTQRLNRGGPGLAGADAQRGLVWNGNWQAGPGRLRSVDDAYTLELKLDSRKPPVIHGAGGVSQKAPGGGRASHYISETRIQVEGSLSYQARQLPVQGLAWMDHEFFTHQLDPSQAGWDWFSMQLDDETELMLFRLRRLDGTVDPYSAGTFISKAGKSRALTARDFLLTPAAIWRSPHTGAPYPIEWRIAVPSLQLDVSVTTPQKDQEATGELKITPNYWEGAVDYQGTAAGRPVRGVGYLEMTGYDKPVEKL